MSMDLISPFTINCFSLAMKWETKTDRYYYYHHHHHHHHHNHPLLIVYKWGSCPKTATRCSCALEHRFPKRPPSISYVYEYKTP
jgi:hypothetical protein